MPSKVLIVEDEPLLLMLAVNLVEEAGFEALEASDAAAAITRLETEADVRILLTDIDMPGSMDGLMLAATVRDRWPPIRIIVVSGKRSPMISELPENAVFFSKPYDVKKMAETLHNLEARLRLEATMDEKIQQAAYARWEAEGRPAGQHERHWREAKEDFSSRSTGIPQTWSSDHGGGVTTPSRGQNGADAIPSSEPGSFKPSELASENK
ncbi:response regulator containing CheY-like receiver domain and AraC-type DNA-binding domain [Rhizobium leguminosarum bv. trifolii WSM2297]|uniref:Response regulator containing CheY-like receiver domain and AraC-type DNA-binding domain n=2 Tax=Rhizobium leguminosarum TaxID=384 RepID=J0L1X4_RHILT|nr:response regulator containing CheY-like receiver domain and AraC-type DNA-binding domain [Rhizobium leguminosarum bv. trifolii WSM2297]